MANLLYTSPLLIVANLKASIAFYVDKLGFNVRFIAPPDDPYFAIVGRDNVELMIKGDADDAGIKPKPNNTRIWWARWDAFISTADPDALYEEYQRTGVVFREPIGINSDGLHGFELEDVNGYVLYFGRPWLK